MVMRQRHFYINESTIGGQSHRFGDNYCRLNILFNDFICMIGVLVGDVLLLAIAYPYIMIINKKAQSF